MNKYTFDAKAKAEATVEWIREYAKEANMHKVVLGMSGGKDSYIAAALCAKAIGKENVFGVILPCNQQKDINDAKRCCESIGIDYEIINIGPTFVQLCNSVKDAEASNEDNRHHIISHPALINIQPRIRMTVLYAIAQSMRARVCGTGNLSERAIGYCTKWGDMASDFNPLAYFTSIEVMAIGDALGLDKDLVHKVPADGLTGMSDEENLGLKYIDIHNYLRGNLSELSEETRNHISEKIKQSEHKRNNIPSFVP